MNKHAMLLTMTPFGLSVQIKMVYMFVLALMLLIPLAAEGEMLREAPQPMVGVCIVNSNPGHEARKRKWREMMKAKATLTSLQFEEWKRCREQKERFQTRIYCIVGAVMLVFLLAIVVLAIRSQYPQSSKKRIRKGNGEDK